MLTLTTIDSFDAAHFLPGHKGKCANMHGHTWRVETTFGPWTDGNLDSVGMAIDFGELKAMVHRILAWVDHQVLNEIINESPTAEHLAVWLKDQLELEGIRPWKIEIWESPESCCTWSRQ
jgi:6-pyruvoyltetrahydropterin/6-carboxytetrahydropterin synthase